MSMQKFTQEPIANDDGKKRDVRSQFGALCYRVKNGKTEILLVTSRGTGRWIVPKGWPVTGETPAGSASVEAYEEAGVVGSVSPICLGIYSYTKSMDGRRNLPCIVALYGVKIKKLLGSFPEQGQRKRRFFSPKKAASLVAEPELKQILKHFDHRRLK